MILHRTSDLTGKGYRYMILVLTSILTIYASAQEGDKGRLIKYIDDNKEMYCDMSRKIWDYAELGFLETNSSRILKEVLEEAGFRIESGVAGMPTAFVARYGKDSPVIGILAEFDALAGLSQDTVPWKKPLIEGGNGHGCGHNLFGTAGVAAAMALKEWMDDSGVKGTICVYGTPAEEGGAGKVYMAREKIFDDADIILHWHPGDNNRTEWSTTLAMFAAKFRFYGLSSHAADAPEQGRSALDGVEAMNHMVNLLREHVPSDSRIHYVITSGGLAPNVIPDFAEVYYYVRNPDVDKLRPIWERVVNAAEGAAKGTGTKMEYEIISGDYSLLPNRIISSVIDTNLNWIGGIHYTPYEQEFAEKIYATFESPDAQLGLEEEIQPLQYRLRSISTDVGDVSWIAPSGWLITATFVPGTSLHSWQAVAAGGMSIGTKGMLLAAKTMALTAYDFYTKPSLVKQANEEFEKSRGKDFEYIPLLGDRKPPLDYKKR
ncbi:MAG: amidohydrolase [Bacteroidales bacterium]|nr:amidohydrolase [Bacteroidales bacterium]